jgi:hypothetical protein
MFMETIDDVLLFQCPGILNAFINDGQQLFVSNMADRTVTQYTGTPAPGYVKATGFSFTESKYDTLGTSAWDIGRPVLMG